MLGNMDRIWLGRIVTWNLLSDRAWVNFEAFAHTAEAPGEARPVIAIALGYQLSPKNRLLLRVSFLGASKNGLGRRRVPDNRGLLQVVDTCLDEQTECAKYDQ